MEVIWFFLVAVRPYTAHGLGPIDVNMHLRSEWHDRTAPSEVIQKSTMPEPDADWQVYPLDEPQEHSSEDPNGAASTVHRQSDYPRTQTPSLSDANGSMIEISDDGEIKMLHASNLTVKNNDLQLQAVGTALLPAGRWTSPADTQMCH